VKTPADRATRRRAALIAASIAGAVAVGAVVMIGADRAPTRNLAPRTVGAFVLDSNVRLVELTAVEELRIDGNKEELDDVGHLYPAPDGRLFVQQAKDQGFRIYGIDGKREGFVGGPGRGPGELLGDGGYGAGWTGDRFWIWDYPQHRLVEYGEDGKLIGQSSLRTAFAAPRDLGRFPALMGQLYVRAVTSDDELLVFAQTWKIGVPDSWTPRAPLLALGELGMIHRLIGDFPRFGQLDTDAITVTPLTGRPFKVTMAFRLLPQLAIAPDGSRIAYLRPVLGDSARGSLVLLVVNSHGDTLISREYPFVGDPISEHTVDSTVDAIVARNPSINDGGSFAREAKKRSPRVKQPVTELRLGRDTTLWIALRASGERRPWMILDGRGDPIATITLPVGARFGAASRGTLWLIEEDANDVPSLVRYRLTGWPTTTVSDPPSSMIKP
jgi:hypothetical protein